MLMDTNEKKITRLIVGICGIIAILSNAMSCKKISGCVTTTSYNEYLVEIPVKLYPAKDTFAMEDTLWLEQNFSDQVHDQRNNMALNFKNFDFLLQMSISDLINSLNPHSPHQVFAEIGIAKEGGSLGAIYLEYAYENGYYKHKMGIVMKQRGLFSLNVRSLRLYDNIDLTRCPTENLDIRYSINNKAENNYYMMKNAKDSITINTTKEDFDRFGSYCFYVK